MILYYAMGGGLGHITRTNALIQQLNLPISKILLLSNSAFATPPFVSSKLQVKTIPSYFQHDLNTYRLWLKKLILDYKITEVYLDAFPVGILGEWADFAEWANLKFYYIARILNWQNYLPYLGERQAFFQKTYLLETLSPAHASFTKQSSSELIPLKIQYPIPATSTKENSFLEYLKNQKNPQWLIIHTEPMIEIEEIYAYAKLKAQIMDINANFLLISPLVTQIKHQQYSKLLNFYPSNLFFPWVDKIVSACGFNMMHQTESYKEKHLFLPFFRRFDDQFLRAEHRKKNI